MDADTLSAYKDGVLWGRVIATAHDQEWSPSDATHGDGLRWGFESLWSGPDYAISIESMPPPAPAQTQAGAA